MSAPCRLVDNPRGHSHVAAEGSALSCSANYSVSPQQFLCCSRSNLSLYSATLRTHTIQLCDLHGVFVGKSGELKHPDASLVH
eukprot:6155667-Amphidinium_carterae.2